jgi:hypothetical protein
MYCAVSSTRSISLLPPLLDHQGILSLVLRYWSGVLQLIDTTERDKHMGLRSPTESCSIFRYPITPADAVLTLGFFVLWTPPSPSNHSPSLWVPSLGAHDVLCAPPRYKRSTWGFSLVWYYSPVSCYGNVSIRDVALSPKPHGPFLTLYL